MSKKSEERKKKYSKITLKNRKRVYNNGKGVYGLERAKKVFTKMSETGGLKPLGEIMLEVGYSESYSKKPQKLVNSKNWQDVSDQYFPLDVLGRKLKDKLNAKTTIIKRVQGGDDEAIEIDNDTIQIKALELAFKTRGLINKKAEGGEVASKGFSLVDLAKSAIELNDQIEERAKKRADEKIDNTKVIDLKSM